jgi:transglutaminase-like putative cysteine protease
MLIGYGFRVTLNVPHLTPVWLRMDVHPDRRLDIVTETNFTMASAALDMTSLDSYGNLIRRILMQPGDTTFELQGVIHDSGQHEPRLTSQGATALHELPDDTLQFLLPSRYCEVDELTPQAWELFGHIADGAARVRAILDYVHQTVTFGYQFARTTRTAAQTMSERVGVCRDFAHLTIALCRCMNIPARYINGYLGDIGVPQVPAPMDFSAWVEVYLNGAWYTVDARHNEPRIGRIVLARGRDATDVPMLHTFGPHVLKEFHVVTDEVVQPVGHRQAPHPAKAA